MHVDARTLASAGDAAAAALTDAGRHCGAPEGAGAADNASGTAERHFCHVNASACDALQIGFSVRGCL